MDVNVSCRSLIGKIEAVASKSDAHRAIIAAALADKPIDISLSTTSNDINATISCLNSLGAQIKLNDGVCRVNPVSGNARDCILDCGESGSTLRFILPVAAALDRKFEITGKGRLPQRPIDVLVEQLREHDATILSDKLPLSVSGKIYGGTYTLPGDVSSQFVSGLMLALPLIGEKCVIRMSSDLQSKAYVDMTIETLAKFNVYWQETEQGYMLDESSKYKTPSSYTVEGDWSNGAFMIVGGILSGNVSVGNLNINSLQADKAIYNIISDIGGNITYFENCVNTRQSEIKPFVLDVSEYPDLFPILAVLACKAKGTSTLFGASRLRLKESDRISSTAQMLMSLGADVIEGDDFITVNGKGILYGGVTDSFGDHRIVMSAAIASCICKNPVTVTNAQAFEKSYPSFINDLYKIGGIVNVI